jgi:hypothetical protein
MIRLAKIVLYIYQNYIDLSLIPKKSISVITTSPSVSSRHYILNVDISPKISSPKPSNQLSSQIQFNLEIISHSYYDTLTTQTGAMRDFK